MKNVYIIAEAGVNHNGSMSLARQLVDVAVIAGADAVKFQTFKTEEVVTRKAPKACYQNKTTDSSETQFEMIKKLELSQKEYIELFHYCKKRKIQFLSSPFDLKSMNFLVNDLEVPCLKIASGEITNAPLLMGAALAGKPIILSTGMSTLAEVEEALGVIAFGYLKLSAKKTPEEFRAAYCSAAGQRILKKKVTLLHCTTEYPAAFGDVNLRVLDTLRMAFNLPVGFSDHTLGIAIPIAAVARGAVLIEKHFTLDQKSYGPDHESSLNPLELKMMVESIRQVELALGVTVKIPRSREIGSRKIVRKSIVAAKNISRGGLFTRNNITTKRPGIGLSPLRYWELMGKIAEKDYVIDETIKIGV